MVNPYRNSGNARFLKALFYEQVTDKSNVLYTLKDVDHEGYKSLYRLYMALEDLTEYEFANKYLDGWEHWTMLCQCEWFKPYVERWREEMELLHKARALNHIKVEAESGSRSSFAANRFLLEGGWKDKKTKGRPSKDQIKKAAKEKAEEQFRLSEFKDIIEGDKDHVH